VTPAPDEGDLIWTDFDPRTGREQGGRRPALVLSPVAFWRATHFAIVCPIASRVRPFPTSTVLPEGLPIAGEILTSHVRSIDTTARPITPVGARVPQAVLARQARGDCGPRVGSWSRAHHVTMRHRRENQRSRAGTSRADPMLAMRQNGPSCSA